MKVVDVVLVIGFLLFLTRNIVDLRRWSQMGHLNHVTCFFGNHDGWCVCVSCDYRWHDTGVHNPQVFDPMHLQLGANDSCWIRSRSHFRSANGMVNCLRVMSRQTFPELV